MMLNIFFKLKLKTKTELYNVYKCEETKRVVLIYFDNKNILCYGGKYEEEKN